MLEFNSCFIPSHPIPLYNCFAGICRNSNRGIGAGMTNTAAIALNKVDGTRYMAPEGSVHVREKGNHDNYHGVVNKHFVGDLVGDSMPVSKDLNDVKVKMFEYDSFLHI